MNKTRVEDKHAREKKVNGGKQIRRMRENCEIT